MGGVEVFEVTYTVHNIMLCLLLLDAGAPNPDKLYKLFQQILKIRNVEHQILYKECQVGVWWGRGGVSGGGVLYNNIMFRFGCWI